MRHLRSLCRLPLIWTLGILSTAWSAYSAEPRISTGDLDPNREAQRYVESALDASAEGDAIWHRLLLENALSVAPDYAPARWQSGYVRVGKEWRTIQESQELAAKDPALRQYHALRISLEGRPNAEEHLALWCRRNGFARRERLHWYRVLLSNPRHVEARKSFGVRWVQGELLSPEALDQRKKEAQAIRLVERQLNGKIKRWLQEVGNESNRKTGAKKEAALAEIRELQELRAIPILESRLSGRNPEISLALVEALGRLDDPRSSISLSRHAVLSPFASVRESATEALASRSIYDFFPLLMGELKLAVRSDFRIEISPTRSVKYVHEIVEEGPEAARVITYEGYLIQRDVDRDSTSPLLFSRNRGSRNRLAARLATRQDEAVEQTKNRTAESFSRLSFNQAQIRTLDVRQENQSRDQINQRIITVMAQLTDQAHGADIRAWWDWWRDYNDIYVPEKPVYRETRSSIATKVYSPPPVRRYECFPAGTPVWTQTGQRPIESIRPGDWVLSQDIETGELTYKPVFDAMFRPATKILTLRAEGQTIRSTLGHPFWVNGKGWRMAKELKPGDSLHSVSGPILVIQITASEDSVAYNLVVADFENYFVGDPGILVHDNSFRKPTRALVPGLVANKKPYRSD